MTDQRPKERQDARNKRLSRVYAELKASNPDAYHKAIMYAEGVSFRLRLSSKTAAEIERAMIVLASELLS